MTLLYHNYTIRNNIIHNYPTILYSLHKLGTYGRQTLIKRARNINHQQVIDTVHLLKNSGAISNIKTNITGITL